MKKDRTRNAGATSNDIAEAHHRVVTTPTVRPRQLIAAGVKRGNGRLVIQAVAA
ncbi:hypothetical protein [Streptomyces sp. sk226]|uniref:hypothetical protein n=1 Tax=Streptomyces sp. sk226 TaxID=2034268 RepID=UPI0015CF1674|nr:hypothetical protein [Streptomyces sp. sk226]